jgi:hypothetical protein
MKHAVTTLWIICCCVTGAAIAEKDPDIWSEASPDKSLVATIRYVPGGEEKNDPGELRIVVFRLERDGTRGQILASTAIIGRVLGCAHWSPDSQFLLFTTSLARGAHGGGILGPSSIAQPTTASDPALRINPGMSSPRSSALTHQTLQC